MWFMKDWKVARALVSSKISLGYIFRAHSNLVIASS